MFFPQKFRSTQKKMTLNSMKKTMSLDGLLQGFPTLLKLLVSVRSCPGYVLTVPVVKSVNAIQIEERCIPRFIENLFLTGLSRGLIEHLISIWMGG